VFFASALYEVAIQADLGRGIWKYNVQLNRMQCSKVQGCYTLLPVGVKHTFSEKAFLIAIQSDGQVVASTMGMDWMQAPMGGQWRPGKGCEADLQHSSSGGQKGLSPLWLLNCSLSTHWGIQAIR
jgi:hypothetical protein